MHANGNGAEALPERTRRTYAADWALFTDWCSVTGNWELPADPETVLSLGCSQGKPNTRHEWILSK